uniref:Uncharacterized protein n=1 Tax=Poecilia latipinna TaxID=48699 RepID=A0A3B3U5F2_9TELE
MSLVVDETAGDLPVRDVGLMRGGLMPTVPADPQRLFRFPRDHLEDLCLRLQEENSVLRQHTRTQEERLRRMSTKLMRLRQARPGSGPVKERDMEDTIQELEARVAVLESQKEVLQNKLGIAKQHILDLGARTPYRYRVESAAGAPPGAGRGPVCHPRKRQHVTHGRHGEERRTNLRQRQHRRWTTIQQPMLSSHLLSSSVS